LRIPSPAFYAASVCALTFKTCRWTLSKVIVVVVVNQILPVEPHDEPMSPAADTIGGNGQLSKFKYGAYLLFCVVRS
jgi:hypothetical protein